MIAITKDEKEIITQRFPNVHIVRTAKQDSKRHHYYCEETKGVMRLLGQLRRGEDPAPVQHRNQNRGYQRYGK